MHAIIAHNNKLLEKALNHEDLMELCEWSLSNIKGTEMKAHITGAKAIMKSFKFMFACKLGKVLSCETYVVNIPALVNLLDKNINYYSDRTDFLFVFKGHFSV